MSAQEQEPGPEQEAQHKAQQEWKQMTRTEEGCKELRDMAESKTGPCPFCKGRHAYQRRFPWGGPSVAKQPATGMQGLPGPKHATES